MALLDDCRQRKFKYSNDKHLYGINRTASANKVLEGSWGMAGKESNFSIDQLYQAWQPIFVKPHVVDNRTVGECTPTCWELISPVTEEEVAIADDLRRGVLDKRGCPVYMDSSLFY